MSRKLHPYSYRGHGHLQGFILHRQCWVSQRNVLEQLLITILKWLRIQFVESQNFFSFIGTLHRTMEEFLNILLILFHQPFSQSTTGFKPFPKIFSLPLRSPCWQSLKYTDCIPCREIRSPTHQKRGCLAYGGEVSVLELWGVWSPTFIAIISRFTLIWSISTF